MTTDYFYNWGTRQSDDPDWKARHLQIVKITCDGVEFDHVAYCQTGKNGHLRYHPTHQGKIIFGKDLIACTGDVVVEFGEGT